ncbi:MAG: hotdog domain-containing protein [Actinomycetota bacterium]
MSATSRSGQRSVYPPPNQILSALGIEVSHRSVDGDPALLARMTADLGLLGRDGRPPGVGALVPLVDLAAGVQITTQAEGDWLVTSDLWINERAPLAAGPLELTATLVRLGRRTGVSLIEVVAGDRGIASATVEFTRVHRDGVSPGTTRATDAWSRLGSGPLLDRPLEQACGFRVVAPGSGQVEVPNSPFVANSTGTLQGGVGALVADAAAADLIGPEARTVDLSYRFLAPVGDGPTLASAELVRVDGAGAKAHHVVRVEVLDVSVDRLVGLATAGVLAG